MWCDCPMGVCVLCDAADADGMGCGKPGRRNGVVVKQELSEQKAGVSLRLS